MESETTSYVVIGIVLVLWLGYAVLAQGNLLFGFFPILLFLLGYACWQVYSVIRDIRDSLRRISDQLERME